MDPLSPVPQFNPLPVSGGRLSPVQQAAALKQARAIRDQQRLQDQEQQATERANQRDVQFQTTSDLRERQFQHTQSDDNERLGIDQERLLLDRAATLSHLEESRFQMEQQRRKYLQAADAVNYFGGLDPKAKDFQQQWYHGMTQFSDVLDHPGVNRVMDSKQKDYTTYTDALRARDISTFTGNAAKVYESTLNQTGDPAIAQRYALAQKDYQDRVTKVMSNPNFTNQDMLQTFNPQTGQVDLDLAERLVAQRTATKTQSDADLKQNTTTLDILTHTLQALRAPKQGGGPGEDVVNEALGGAPTAPESDTRKAARDAAEKTVLALIKRVGGNGTSPLIPAPVSLTPAGTTAPAPAANAPASPPASTNPAPTSANGTDPNDDSGVTTTPPDNSGSGVASTQNTGNSPASKTLDQATATSIAQEAAKALGPNAQPADIRAAAAKLATSRGYQF